MLLQLLDLILYLLVLNCLLNRIIEIYCNVWNTTISLLVRLSHIYFIYIELFFRFRTLPRIEFSKLDNLLQRQLYYRCFPVIRKRLWNCSSKTSNPGKKPANFLACHCGFGYGDCLLVNFDENTVISAYETCDFSRFKPELFMKIGKFFDFNVDLVMFN